MIAMRKMLAVLFGLSLLMPLAACKRSKAPLTPQAPDWMEPELAKIAQSMSPGAEQVGQTFKAIAFREDDYTDWRIDLAPGACYLFVGIGDQTSEEMYIALYDPEDDRVNREKEEPARVAMEWCVEKPGLHRIQGKITEGHGHYAVAVFVKGGAGGHARPPHPGPHPGAHPAPQPEPGPATTDPTPAPKPRDLEAVITAQAKSGAPGATRIGDFFTGTADKTDWYTALEQGKCYWFMGAGDQGISELHIYLWDPEDKRITANKSATNRVQVGHCPTTSGMYHFQAKVNAGHGTYKVGVFAKKK